VITQPASHTAFFKLNIDAYFAEIASVIAAYSATGPEQLSLQPGQVIQVRKKSSSGWWEGELQVSVYLDVV
jgi:hypothetical protein